MTNVISLEDLRKRADAEYAPYKIDVDGETLVLRNTLRLPKQRREKVTELIKELADLREKLGDAEDSEDTTDSLDQNEAVDRLLEIMNSIIGYSADDEDLASKLLDEIGDDFALVSIVFSDWFEEDEVGEASNSPAV